VADSSDIDNALVAYLGADSMLLALVPNGVYFDQAPPNSTRFVIVSLVDESDEQMFQARAYEDALYRVEVFMLKSANGNPKAAFARVDALLEGATLTIPDYSVMTLHRESRERRTERDEADESIIWYRRAGNYRLTVST
jgi:hypothetical protein